MTDTTTQQRTPEEIERDIRSTQEEMSRTVEQLGGELTPRNIINSLFDKADAGGVDMRYLLDGARRNPLALGMIGAGALWLVSDADARPSAMGISGIGSKNEQDQKDKASSGVSAGDWHPDHRRYLEHMSICNPETGEDDQAYRRRRDLKRANYFMVEQRHDEDESAFRQRLDAATDQARDTWNKTSNSAKRMVSSTKERTNAVVSDVQDLYGDNPLLSGLAAAFVGAVAGAMLPATQTEERYVGGLGEQALGIAGEQVKKVGDAAREKKDDVIDQIDQKVGASQQHIDAGNQQMGGMGVRQNTGVGQEA